ncbi:glycosyltransferase family 2 protein [bacterium]|nr:glycosyltransferase family 2 protein [bacterium]
MPIYNEGAVIRGNLRRTATVLRPLGPFEMIAANDGSTDSTREELDRAAAEIPELRALHLPHRGKGEALRQGTQAAGGDWVIFLDADLDLPPEQITLFLALQRTHQADAVIGSKMHPDSNIDYPPLRRLYSWGYYRLVRCLFGLPVRDTQTGLKLVRRDLLVQALERTELTGFAFDLELLVHLVRLGARMAEAPVVVNHSLKFGSKVGFRAIAGIARDTLRTWRNVRHRHGA